METVATYRPLKLGHMTNENEGEWLTTADACHVLGISDRTLKRRVEAGAIESRLEALPRGGVRRLVRATNRAGQEKTAEGPNVRATNERKSETARASEEIRAGHAGQIERATRGPEVESGNVATPQVERLEKEVEFLRGLVEQHQRGEAELRAALREALRAMPKQLTEGTAAPPVALRTPEILPAVVSPVEREKAPKIGSNRGARSDKEPRPLWKVMLGIR
jgi:hypothetical protein